LQETVEIRESGKIIAIDFSTPFKHDLEHLHEFSLAPKRNFANIADSIKEILGYVIGRSESVLYGFLHLQNRLQDEDVILSEEEVADLVMSEIVNDDARAIIDEHIESTYSVNLDEMTKTTKKVNEELQFTDMHARIILKASMAMRLSIPALTQYLHVYQLGKSENLFFNVFSRIMDAFTPEGYDAKAKIMKLTGSILSSTRYSDKVLWAYLKNMALDIQTLHREFFKKLLVNVLPKLKVDQNVVPYLHVTIKNQIDFLFRSKFAVSYKSVNMMESDSEGLTEFDKFESQMAMVDEGMSVISKDSISEEIENTARAIGTTLTVQELEYFRERIVINKTQTNLVFTFFSKFVGDYFDLYNCSKDEYVALCVLTRKWLQKNGYRYLWQYVTGIPDELRERKTINKKEFMDRLLSSRQYKSLFDQQYKHTVSNIVDSGVILKTIATLKANKFYNIPDMEEGSDVMAEIDPKIEDLSAEFLNFVAAAV
jgi:hypothetical protein